jgi:hypothetical protein
LRPHEERQTEEREPFGSKLDDRDDEVDRPQKRGRDQTEHAEQPPCLSRRRDVRERGVGGPAGVGRAAGHEEAGEHDHAAHEVHPVAGHVQLGERHVGRADLERHHEVAKSADGQRDDPEEHHDGAVHRAKLVVELGKHDAARSVGLAEIGTDNRNGLAGIRQLPPHQRHQAETEEEKEEAGDAVLDADHLMVLGEDVLLPEPELVFVLVRHVSRMRPVRADRHLVQDFAPFAEPAVELYRGKFYLSPERRRKCGRPCRTIA